MTSPSNQDGSPETESAVFFSYSRTNRAQALPIIHFIEAAGYRVWWDGKLEGGSEFLKHTEKALEQAKAVVVLWSRDSVASHWVRDEATSGRERRRLIPLSLDGTMPPLGFRQIQVIDMQNWRANEDAKAQLLNRLAKLHGRPLGEDRQFEERITVSTAPVLSKRSVLLGGTAFLAAGTVGIIWRDRQSSPLGDIAVLPFENLLGDESLDYLSDGLASAVRDRLSMNPSLKVTARSSSREAMQTLPDAVSIARTLQVDSLLEGRLERFGSEEQVNVSLVKGRDGLVEWTESFPFNPTRILDVRDAIIQRITQSLSGFDQSDIADSKVAPQAYDEYLRGKALLDRGATLERVERARDHFARAVELDPKFGLAHAELADQLLLLGVVNSDKAVSQNFIGQAFSSAETAVASSPDLASTHVILGHVRMSGRSDFQGAQEAYSKAQALGLHKTEDIARYAIFEASIGRTDAAIFEARRGVTRDPLDPMIREVLAYATYASGDFAKAATLYRDVLDMDPDRYTVRAWLGLSEIYGGNPARGLQICAEEKNDMERLTCEAIAHHRLGNVDQANTALATLLNSYGDSAAYQEAQIRAQAGELDGAMATLDRAETLQDSGLGLLKIDPAMNPLREREDFKALLVRRGMSG